MLDNRRRGSMTLRPSKGKNHSLPSEAFATGGLNGPPLARLRTPSGLPKTVSRNCAWEGRLPSARLAHASISARAIFTSPHGMYTQKSPSSSSIVQ